MYLKLLENKTKKTQISREQEIIKIRAEFEI
jgi:hypothetical protein